MSRLLCLLGVHRFVGVASYSLEQIPGYTLCFHKEVCARCNRVRERMMRPMTPGESVSLELELASMKPLLRWITGKKDED